MQPSTLRSTHWLAKRLGLSVSTIERFRANVRTPKLPPFIRIGASIRYDEAAVERWLQGRFAAQDAAKTNSTTGGDHVLAA